MRGSSIKSFFLINLHRVGRVLPAGVTELLLRGVIGVVKLAYWVPFNPLRTNCVHVTALASAAGHEHRPHAIYRRLLGQISLVLRSFVRVVHRGKGAALARVTIDGVLNARVTELLARHGSLILAVPHNATAVFSAMGLPSDRTVLVVRNREGRHNRVSKEVIERMQLETLEVRNLSPIAMTRAIMKALGDGKALVATVDNSYRKPDAVSIDVFGLPKGFGPWAARVAAKRGVPVVPCYPREKDGGVGFWIGEPKIDADPAVLMEHYVRFFEDCILRDPGSWAFLGDKRWGAHLAEAHAALDARIPA